MKVVEFCYAHLRRPSVLATLFAIFALALIVILKFDFLFANYVIPWGDYAADDIQILEAKHFTLWHGNYSRVGFYHPGPFYYQWMALFEFLFVDMLPLCASPHAAHVFGLAALHVLSYAIYFRLWLLWSGKLWVAVMALLATFAVTLYGVGSNFIVQPWPPYMYLASSLMTVTGFIGVIIRGTTWLPLLVFGMVQLFHGHASFMGLIPIMIVLAIIISIALGRLPLRSLSLSEAHTFVTRNRGALISSALILSIFLLPVVLQTLLTWPGEIPKYFKFAAKARSQTAIDAAIYVASFVPAYGMWALALLITRPQPSHSVITYASELRFISLFLLVTGCITAWVYAWKGIDTLELRYLILWLLPFVGAALTAAIVRLAELLGRRGSLLLATTVVVASISCIYKTPQIITDESDINYIPAHERNSTQLSSAVGQLRALIPVGMQISLKLSNGLPDWGTVWPDTVSLIAFMNRNDQHFVCIDPASWHLVFHEKYRCDPTHKDVAKVFWIRGKASPNADVKAKLYSSVVASARPPTIGTVFEADDVGLLLADGWSYQEKWGVWSDGPRSRIVFDATALPKEFIMIIRARLIPRDQSVRIFDEAGHILAQMSGANTSSPIVLIIDRSTSHNPRAFSLLFSIQKPTAPAELGWSADHRRLGVGLESISF